MPTPSHSQTRPNSYTDIFKIKPDPIKEARRPSLPSALPLLRALPSLRESNGQVRIPLLTRRTVSSRWRDDAGMAGEKKEGKRQEDKKHGDDYKREMGGTKQKEGKENIREDREKIEKRAGKSTGATGLRRLLNGGKSFSFPSSSLHLPIPPVQETSKARRLITTESRFSPSTPPPPPMLFESTYDTSFPSLLYDTSTSSSSAPVTILRPTRSTAPPNTPVLPIPTSLTRENVTIGTGAQFDPLPLPQFDQMQIWLKRTMCEAGLLINENEYVPVVDYTGWNPNFQNPADIYSSQVVNDDVDPFTEGLGGMAIGEALGQLWEYGSSSWEGDGTDDGSSSAMSRTSHHFETLLVSDTSFEMNPSPNRSERDDGISGPSRDKSGDHNH